jgi:magnesium chelatase family protein
MTPALLDRDAALGSAARQLLVTACDRLGLSARAFDRVRRVARTIADLDGHVDIEPRHVAEVLRYRDAQVG